MKLYLDVDGVLNPDTGSPRWENWDYHDCNVGFSIRLLLSSDMLQALIDVCEEHDIEIVWATTWIIRDYVDQLPAITGLPDNLRKIELGWGTDGYEDGRLFVARGCGKLSGVKSDAGSDGPIIWIDDCLSGEDYEFADERSGATLMLKPFARWGLTSQMIEAIDEFATNNKESDDRTTITT